MLTPRVPLFEGAYNNGNGNERRWTGG